MAFVTPGWEIVLDFMQASNASLLSLPVLAQAMATERKSVAAGGPFLEPAAGRGVDGKTGATGCAIGAGNSGVAGGPKIWASEPVQISASRAPDIVFFMVRPFEIAMITARLNRTRQRKSAQQLLKCTGLIYNRDMTTTTAFKFGQLQGHIPLTPDVAASARKMGADHYAAELANEFDGEDVEVFEVPRWAPKIEAWWPAQELRELGFKRYVGDASFGGLARQDIVVTFGVDQHIDDFHGPVLCYVLHNDGLAFRQGAKGFVPVGGDWFVFNDRVKHGVKEAKGASVFVGWTVPLAEVD